MVTKKNRTSWGVAEAKAHLSEILERAAREPQIIRRRGRPVGVVINFEHFGETEEHARVGSAARRMRSFLELSAAIREQGGVDLRLPKRAPRPSPFSET